MAFLQNLFRTREIGKLEGLIQTSPAPSLFLRLSQLYAESDDKDRALKIIRMGAEMFPENEALRDACTDADRCKLETERMHLKSRVEQYPSPVMYSRLAEICLKLDKPEEAEAVCNQGIKLDPDYGGLWGVRGRIALQQNNLPQGIEYLEKATSQDQHNYNALILLSECYLRNNQHAAGREALEKILTFAPGDEQVSRWLADFDAHANAFAPAAPVVETAAATASPSEAEDKKSSGVGTGLHVGLREIRRVAGVRGTILIDAQGMVIAADLPDGLPEDLASALITNIARTVSEYAEVLTLGEFEEGICDTDQGTLYVLKIAQMIVAVFASPETKIGLLQRAIRSFAEQAKKTLH